MCIFCTVSCGGDLVVTAVVVAACLLPKDFLLFYFTLFRWFALIINFLQVDSDSINIEKDKCLAIIFSQKDIHLTGKK